MQTIPRPDRVLLIRPSALGDVCRSVPVLTSLRAAWPQARIDWLVQDAFAPAVSAHPALDAVLPFPRGTLTKPLSRQGRAALAELHARLRAPRYDLVIDAQGLGRSAALARWTGAPYRLGLRSAREGAPLLYTHKAADTGREHAVDRMMTLVDALGLERVTDMALHASLEDRAWAAAFADDNAGSGGPLVVVAPTSRWHAKRWPIERFAQTVGCLRREAAARIIVVGGTGEREQCAPLLAALRNDHGRNHDRDLVGRTSVGQLMALIERADLVIANDSAALHMAVGFDRPIVALFGPTRVDLVGPYRRDRDVLQRLGPGDPPELMDHKSPRGSQLMERISVAEVVSAALAHLRHAAPRP